LEIGHGSNLVNVDLEFICQLPLKSGYYKSGYYKSGISLPAVVNCSRHFNPNSEHLETSTASSESEERVINNFISVFISGARKMVHKIVP